MSQCTKADLQEMYGDDRLDQLAFLAGCHKHLLSASNSDPSGWIIQEESLRKFAELIVEECRSVLNELYQKTPLELCGPLLTADEEIVKHFYGAGG